MAVVGIDLGTTYSAVAVLKDGGPQIIPNSEEDRTTPSVVGLSRGGELLVGRRAKNAAGLGNTIAEVKRVMGKAQTLRLGDRILRPQEVSAFILDKLVRDSEAFLGEKVTGAVITIPAHFQEPARAATREAGQIAGLEVGAILDEPTAAAISYGLKKKEDLTILVYDMGGGTTDISLIEIAEGVFEVLSITGNNELGGRDFDKKIVEVCLERIRRETGEDFQSDPGIVRLLENEAENAKRELTTAPHSTIMIPRLLPGFDFEYTLTSEAFIDLIRDDVKSTELLLQNALDQAELTLDDIDNVLLVGGSTRIPIVQETVAEFVGKEPLKDISPDECVALGAAVMTGVVKWSDEFRAREPNLPDLRQMKDEDGEEMVVEPVLRTAHPLGIGVVQDGMPDVLSIIIDRGTQYPVSVTAENFSTMRDGQEKVQVPVFEGDNPVASRNIPLGEVVVDLPRHPPVPANSEVAVTFTINQDRILEVEVQLPGNPGVGAKAAVESPGRLSEEERQRVIRDRAGASREARTDIPRQVATKVILDARRMTDANREYLDPALVAKVERIIVTLEDAMEAGNVKLMMQKGAELQNAMKEMRRILL